jgi:hypothetical protein
MDATGLSRGFFTLIGLSKQATLAAIVNHHGASPWHTVTVDSKSSLAVNVILHRASRWYQFEIDPLPRLPPARS